MTLNEALGQERGSGGAPRWLTVLAALETLSLAVLVLNRLTIDVRPLAAALGPVHGAFYLGIVIAVASRRPGAPTVLLALVPVLGGLLATWRLRRRSHGPDAGGSMPAPDALRPRRTRGTPR